MKIKLCPVEDQPKEGKAKSFSLEDGRQVILFRSNNELFCLEDRCPHMGGRLQGGTVEGRCIVCPWHGYAFDLKTGASKEFHKKAVSFQVTEEEGFLFLS
ncbi:MAG: Rieske (2Fe-2S) protein [Chlamydiales bacterium]|jgi:nitrite reductase/ring-hydroxylating ferredoxin subunit|nr:Rieske (2Fe-2S) protein [Chlamydiales bacterium]